MMQEQDRSDREAEAAGRDADRFDLDGDHWQFALQVYGRPGVADICLRLQDRWNVDVNVLLFALYATVIEGFEVDGATVAAADGHVRDWRTTVVVPLREIRRAMKSEPAISKIPTALALRTKIKTIELGAEQIEQALLSGWLRGAGLRHGAFRDPQAALAAVVSHFAETRGGASETPDRGQLEVLAQAAVSAARQAKRPRR